MLTTIIFPLQLFGVVMRRINCPLNLLCEQNNLRSNGKFRSHSPYSSLANGEERSNKVLISESGTYLFQKAVSA